MSDDDKRAVPAGASLITYFLMLVGALVILAGQQIFTTSEGFSFGIQLALLFPCGLSALAGPGSRGVGLGLALISYASFIAFFVAFFRVRTWATYGLLCAGFAFLLMLNVAGCHAMHKGLSGITMMPNTGANPSFAQRICE